ncbi:MAG TPA: hypothetical protein VJA47_00985 [archaeon]|nr:hypothetical protein [archaeon]
MEKQLGLLLKQFEHGNTLEDYHKITTGKELDEHYTERVRKLNHQVVSGFIEAEDTGLNHLFNVLEKGDTHSKQKAAHVLEEIGKKLRDDYFEKVRLFLKERSEAEQDEHVRKRIVHVLQMFGVRPKGQRSDIDHQIIGGV